MTTTAASRIELPEGYAVSERLGAGGYGEVWRATAPGGVEKAIKLVFGHCDEELAERELKSLDRIRSVRHPFVLSLERYEVVGGRLVIVTELADMSLDQCFSRHREAGLPGIPREELLSYLSDAAEALDYLFQSHRLQHLDVKPENLLVVGSHVKVADFGLVKELATRTMHSMMGGMTPLYSAPEVYDDNPSAHSDQYSLAIVYQQMLTGQLPFPGRTPAQLAKQHTQAEPNLKSLSEADAHVVGRALAKSPDARFASCREFVDALRTADARLRRAEETPAEPSDGATRPIDRTSEEDTKSSANLKTAPVDAPARRPDVTHPLGAPQPAPAAPARDAPEFPPVDGTIVDLPAPPASELPLAPPAPTLFVAIGGMGLKMLSFTRAAIEGAAPDDANPTVAWLAIDTDRDALVAARRLPGPAALSSDDMLHIPLRRPKQYRDSSVMLDWVSRRWLYNIPRSLQTRGFRPLGRLAAVDHAGEIVRRVHERLNALASHADAQQPRVSVVVLAGMSGGTGAGAAMDVAQAARSVATELGMEADVQGVLGVTCRHEPGSDSLAAANMYSLLTELTHAQGEGNRGPNEMPGPAVHFESSHPPFDAVQCVAIPPRSRAGESDQMLRGLAAYLALGATTEAGVALRACRDRSLHEASKDANSVRFGTVACAAPNDIARSLAEAVRCGLRDAVARRWLTPEGAPPTDELKAFHDHAATLFAQRVAELLPRPAEKAADGGDVQPGGQPRPERPAMMRLAAEALDAFHAAGAANGAVAPPAQLQSIVETVSESVIRDLCDRVSTHHAAPDLGELLDARLTEAIDSSGVVAMDNVAQAAVTATDSGVMECGYKRRTLVVTPLEGEECDTVDAFATLRSHMTVVPARVPQAYLVCQGAGLRPLDLAARLNEACPGVVDAAGRLHARSDISWPDLRDG